MGNLHNVTFGSNFFVKDAKRGYNHPLAAYVRELLQNSRDAGANQISFDLTETDNKIVMTCLDNGCGMTEDVITQKLMALGETNKKEGSIGGFGIAKILLFFSQLEYTIYTKDLVVLGEGGSYMVDKSGEYQEGTKVVVTLNQEVLGGYDKELKLDDTISMFRYQIGKSDLKGIKVIVNNEKITNYTRLTKRQLVYDDADFSIYKTKCKWGTNNYIDVRVGGLYMFQEYGNESKYKAVVELKGYSVDYLNTHRDGLRYGTKADKLKALVQEMTQDMRSFDKTKKPRLEKYAAEMNFSQYMKDILSRIQATITQSVKLGMSKADVVASVSKVVQATFEKSEQSEKLSTEKIEQITKQLERKIETMKNLQTISFNIQDIDTSDLNLDYSYLIYTDEDVTKTPQNIKPKHLTKKNKKVLDVWGRVLYQVLKDSGIKDPDFDIGFLNSTPDKGAMYVKRGGETIPAFFINANSYLGVEKAYPVCEQNAQMIITILKDTAIHKVTHFLGRTGHNNDFIEKENFVKNQTYKSLDKYATLWN